MSHKDETIHYSRCRMVPTPSSLAAQLGSLREQADRIKHASISIEFGDYDHRDDRYWMRHAGSSKALFARAQGADTHVVAFSTCESCERILVRADSAIRSPADLEGRRIAVPRVPARAFDVDRMVHLKPIVTALRSAGLRLSDVHLVDTSFERAKLCDAPPEPRSFFEVATEELLIQLRRGEVDAIASLVQPEPAVDLREIYRSRDDPTMIARGELRALVVSGPLLRDFRDIVVGFVARLLEAAAWAAVHSARVPSLVATDIGLTEAALERREFRWGDWARIGCERHHVDAASCWAELLRTEQIIPGELSLTEWIDSTVLPDARRLIAESGGTTSSCRPG